MNAALKMACGVLCFGLAATGLDAVAHAQAGRTPGAPPVRPDQPPQRDMRPVPPDRSPSPGESLSQSQGVIHPPDTQDPGVISPPNTAKTPMPEIRPPGTPGGDPDIHPK
jgi:hypothetical protein